MDQYRKLAKNTVIVGIGSFSSKLLVFFLMPITTRILTKAEMGSYDLAFQTASLLYPVVSLGVANAILRFGLDKNEDKTDVFSTGLFTSLIGLLVLLAFVPLGGRVDAISQNTLGIYLYVFFATLHAVCSCFIRACEQVKLYAADGILCTVLMVLFTVLFLVVFKMGVTGYLLATSASNAVSIIFLFIRAKLYRYIRLRGLNRKTALAMLKYSVPLMPSMIFWWITNVSDRFLVTHFMGSAANGLYAVSNKAPQIIVIVSNIFSDAWLISAVTEGDRGRDNFFTKVFKSYQAVVFIGASGLIMCAQLVTRILVDASFFESWRFMPILVIATVFSCFVTFLQSIYFVEKKSVISLVTMFAGALVNVILNLFLIPAYGINGAALSTLICYIFVFVLRAVNTGNYIKIRFNILTLGANFLILMAQTYILLKELSYWPIYEAALFAIVLLLNFKPLLQSVQKIIKR
ncbi:polysaccharide biosynthesis C-terminal domain-containing protein [Sporobacter termitidis]|uniref:oligosaccharide flippase family protein n=1 Tax=Sporobacter termitidis TaxID=44749 RepID=UPI0013562FD6|nr:polysaccharide biosynthesis C-terminal domain-containing protein [Sporobacter termitidis]